MGEADAWKSLLYGEHLEIPFSSPSSNTKSTGERNLLRLTTYTHLSPLSWTLGRFNFANVINEDEIYIAFVSQVSLNGKQLALPTSCDWQELIRCGAIKKCHLHVGPYQFFCEINRWHLAFVLLMWLQFSINVILLSDKTVFYSQFRPWTDMDIYWSVPVTCLALDGWIVSHPFHCHGLNQVHDNIACAHTSWQKRKESGCLGWYIPH